MLTGPFILLALGAHVCCTFSAVAPLIGASVDSKDGYAADEERLQELEDSVNSLLMSLYATELQAQQKEAANKYNDKSLAKRINFLGSRGKRLQFLGSRGKRLQFLGSRGKRLQFLGSRG